LTVSPCIAWSGTANSRFPATTAETRLRKAATIAICGLAVLGSAQVVQAADWYVDVAAPTAGSGASPQAAWRRFADIDWSRLKPGDTLHILGGPCDPPYRETLVVGAGGTAAAPLVIKGAARAGAGSPVIDGENRREGGVILRRRDHVTLRNLDIRNHPDAGIVVHEARAGVLVEGNRIFSGDPGGGNARGIDARRNAGPTPLIVRANRFTTPARTKAQTDGIYSMDNDGGVFEGNHIVVSNADTTGHSDNFQSFRDRRITVRDNWFEQANTAITDNHGAWMSNTRTGGTIEFHSNVVLAPNLTGDAAVAHHLTDDWTETGTAVIRNNTIIGGGRAVTLANSPQARVLNNIIVPPPGGRALVILDTAPPASHIDNNLLGLPLRTVAYVDMEKRHLSWAEWRARGYEARGAVADPPPSATDPERLRMAGAVPLGGRGASLLPPPLANPPTCLPAGPRPARR
jgi:hypothetical protein